MAALRRCMRWGSLAAAAASLAAVSVAPSSFSNRLLSEHVSSSDRLSSSWISLSMGMPLDNSIAGLATVGEGLLRSYRAVYTFTVNTCDYKYSLRHYEEKTEDYYKALSEVHIRAAKRILKLCETNRGFYTKAGQFVASMQQMPKEVTSTLAILQDKAQPWPFTAIEKVFLEEFEKSPLEMYAEFDAQPIAAASLAQVHHAVLKNGQDVAVKVQYPGLQQQFLIDIITMKILSKAIAWVFPEYQFEWIVPEFEKNLSKELDFLQEASNAEKTGRNFSKKEVVKVPEIHWELCTKRVLTMQFMYGWKVDDVQSLVKAGIDPKKVAEVLAEVFAAMIFCHGFVHGDPHPGNILVSGSGNKFASNRSDFAIVLLDHGLYRELDEQFRSEFCHLWKALILLDPVKLREAGERLGAGQYYRYLPVIFTGRSLSSKSGLGQGMSPEEKMYLKDELRNFSVGDISQFMEGLPRDFLTILRTDGLLRSIIAKLGAESRVRLLIYAKYAVLGAALGHDDAPAQNWKVALKASLEYGQLRIRLETLEIAHKLESCYCALVNWLRAFGSGIQGLFSLGLSIVYGLLP